MKTNGEGFITTGFVPLLLPSDSFYLFFANNTTHPFYVDAWKQSFSPLFIPYCVFSTCVIQILRINSTIDLLYCQLVCPPKSERKWYRIGCLSIHLSLLSSVSTVKLRTNTTDLPIYLPIYLSTYARIENRRVSPLVDESKRSTKRGNCDSRFKALKDFVFTDSRRYGYRILIPSRLSPPGKSI